MVVVRAADRALIRAVRRELRRQADPEKAAPMQAYMKSEMPFFGVQSRGQAVAFAAVFDTQPLDSFQAWHDTVLELWQKAHYREERYAAIALTGEHPYEEFRTMDALPLYEELVTTGAWWDYVDWIATKRLRELLIRFPDGASKAMLEWSRSDDLWKRRSSILSQIGRKEQTDRELLYACIGPSLGDREFFLRKAIGWALREYSKTAPDEVARYVREHEDRMSPLSRREALRRIPSTALPEQTG